MSHDEVFANPTVKQVIFQIRFPCLFFIDKLIGDYQVKVMEKFPESKLLVQRQFFIAQTPESIEQVELPEEASAFPVKKIWQFIAPEGVTLSVQDESLDLVSSQHKTYSNPAAEHRFRDLIEFAVGQFLDLSNLPVISRMGLRYIDECPVPAAENDIFQEYYETTLPLARFPLADSIEMSFRGRVRKKGHFFVFREAYKIKDDSPTLTLDFDGYAVNVKTGEYLTVADTLHEIVVEEYFRSIKEPVLTYMREPKE